MLKKTDIIKKLIILNMPKEQYCVMAGAALVMHGVKEYTRDIDIACSEGLFQKLQQQGHKTQQIKDYEGIIIDDCIEIFRNWESQNKVYIENIPVSDLLSIRSYKQNLGREKDLVDIRLIDEYLAAKEKTELES